MVEAAGFRVNEPNVVAEVVEGEVIILSFEHGTYYSLNESGMAIWQGIRDGLDRAALLSSLQRQFEAPVAELEADLARLLHILQSEQLIVPCAPGSDSARGVDASPMRPYTAPHLEKFSDLQDLLLLDPIHDTTDSGWPHNPR